MGIFRRIGRKYWEFRRKCWNRQVHRLGQLLDCPIQGIPRSEVSVKDIFELRIAIMHTDHKLYVHKNKITMKKVIK